MLHSMTGYGSAEKLEKSSNIVVEAKSVNSKTLDLKINLPESLKAFEADIRALCAKDLVRGKVEVYISVVSQNDGFPIFDSSLAMHYKSEILKLSRKLNVSSVLDIKAILNLPNLIIKPYSNSKITGAMLSKLVLHAISSLVAFRINEGKLLEKDFLSRIKRIQGLLKKTKVLAPLRLKKIRARLSGHLKTLGSSEKIDKNRFEQEVLYYLEKLDISEELTRLDGYLAFFVKEMKNKSIAKGKKLGFISQEIGREINTIGSKSNDAKMQILVVEMKDELEKIKEQLANIL